MTADFAAIVTQTVRDGRALAEARMLTTCAIQYVTGETAQDPVSGSEAPIYTTAFTTKCRIKSPGLAVRQGEVGGRTSSTVTRELHIPALSTDPWNDERSAEGVTALVTSIDPTDDPSLLGARLLLSGAAPGSQTTARRLQVTEIVQ